MNASSYEWIICEGRGLWAAALRVAIWRRDDRSVRAPRLYEVRKLEELNARLTTRPKSMAFVEVHNGTLGDLLNWAAASRRLQPDSRFVALVDRTLVAQRECEISMTARLPDRLLDALLEVGACEIVLSPRHLPRILPIALRHAKMAASRSRSAVGDETIADWAWSLLPWQAEKP